jgi:hypothetical protein
MKDRTIELLPLSFRADVSSINRERRTCEAIFSTGAAVDRVDFAGRKFREKLSLEPRHVRLERLNDGAPVLNAHHAETIADVVGTVEPGSARIEGGRGLARLRFSQRAATLFADIADGIVRAVSIGYRVYKFAEADGPDSIPVRTAIDWEPFEISVVPIAADAGASVRADPAEMNRCTIVTDDTSDAARPRTDADRLRQLEAANARSLELAGRGAYPPSYVTAFFRALADNDTERVARLEEARAAGFADTDRNYRAGL